MTPTLAPLGVTDVFNHSRAALAGITAELASGLVVSKIIHTSMLEMTMGDSELTPTN